MHYQDFEDIIEVDGARVRGMLDIDLKDVKGTKYIVEEGDRLDLISYKVYGVCWLWWLIALANGKKHCLDVEVGEVLVIPNYSILYDLKNRRR